MNATFIQRISNAVSATKPALAILLTCAWNFAFGAPHQVAGASTSESFATYKRSAAQLSMHWSPDFEKMPIDLGKESAAARSFLIESHLITNQIDLTIVTMVRLSSTLDSTKENHELTNKWSLGFGFQVQPDARQLFVSAGSRIGETNARTIEYKNTQINHPASSGLRPFKYKESPDQPNPYAALHQPHFALPRVQWFPSEPFPMDLSAEAVRMKEYITKTMSIKDSLELEEISIESFLPYEAIVAKQAVFFENIHHWLVVFRFQRMDKGSPKPGYNAYLLLNGTVLQVNMHSMPERQSH